MQSISSGVLFELKRTANDVMRKQYNKQHDIRAASLKRLAKSFRAMARLWREPPFPEFLRELAEKFDEEADLLRAMR